MIQVTDSIPWVHGESPLVTLATLLPSSLCSLVFGISLVPTCWSMPTSQDVLHTTIDKFSKWLGYHTPLLILSSIAANSNFKKLIFNTIDGGSLWELSHFSTNSSLENLQHNSVSIHLIITKSAPHTAWVGWGGSWWSFSSISKLKHFHIDITHVCHNIYTNIFTC